MSVSADTDWTAFNWDITVRKIEVKFLHILHEYISDYIQQHVLRWLGHWLLKTYQNRDRSLKYKGFISSGIWDPVEDYIYMSNDLMIDDMARVKNLYIIECFHMKCAIRMIIWATVILITVFWPVGTQISIRKGNLNCAIQMMV